MTTGKVIHGPWARMATLADLGAVTLFDLDAVVFGLAAAVWFQRVRQ